MTGQPSSRRWHTLTLRAQESPHQAVQAHVQEHAPAATAGGPLPPRVLHLILDRAPQQQARSVLEAAFHDADFAHDLLADPMRNPPHFERSWQRLLEQAWSMAQPAPLLLATYRQRVPSSAMAAAHHAQLEVLQAVLHGIDAAVVAQWRDQLRRLLPYTAGAQHRPSVAGIAYWQRAGFSPPLLADWLGQQPRPLVEDPRLQAHDLLPFAQAGWSIHDYQRLSRVLTQAVDATASRAEAADTDVRRAAAASPHIGRAAAPGQALSSTDDLRRMRQPEPA